MSLCTICASLDLRSLTDNGDDPQDVVHHNSLRDLKVSARFCPLCHLFFKELSLQPLFSLENGNSSIILRGAQSFDTDWNMGGIYGLRARCDSARIIARFSLYPDEGLH
jgi:hypothetical protein